MTVSIFTVKQERVKAQKDKKKAKKAASAAAAAASAGADADAQSESSATAPETSAAAAASGARGKGGRRSGGAGLDDGGWTRVETKKTARGVGGATAAQKDGLEVSTSDAGVTTSVTGTGNSSPVTERTEELEEGSHLADSVDSMPENRRTLAEKLLPKPRKTGVEEYVSSSLLSSV